MIGVAFSPDGEIRLNALSGIGGVQTSKRPFLTLYWDEIVLMPCRALEAFRRARNHVGPRAERKRVLMPCRALEAFRRMVQ